METNIIHNKDCFELLKELDDNSIDCIITDPPWLTTNLKFDTSCDMDFIVKTFRELYRVLKDTGWCFSKMPIDMYCDIKINTDFKSKFEYIWNKQRGTMQTHNTVSPRKKHEYIFALYKHKKIKKMNDLTFNSKDIRTKGEPYTKIEKKEVIMTEFQKANRLRSTDPRVVVGRDYREPVSVLDCNSKTGMKYSERTAHPTQAPLYIMETIVKGYANRNDVILDPFIGSGTTAVACINLDRKYIGCELDKDYYKIAIDRVNKAKIDLNKEELKGSEDEVNAEWNEHKKDSLFD